MSFRTTASRFLVVASALAIGACADAPTPVEPAGNDQLSAASAQASISRLFPTASARILDLDRTVFADHDERLGKLVFGVEDAFAIGSVVRELDAMGVSRDSYQVEITEPIVQVATLRDKFRPTQGGIQIHWSNYVCTLGFNVDHGTERSFITNSHCTNTQGGVEGTEYAQPTRTVDPTVIAVEVEDPLYFKGGVCPRGKKCRYSDASRANYNSSVASNRGDIAKTTGPNNGDLTVAGVFTVGTQDNTTTNFPIGQTLNKVGRTTGWSQGPVSRTCVNTNVSGSQVHQLCQTFVDAAVDGGDSGSPVFAITSGDNVQLVGILWGGGTGYYVFSPLANIQRTTEIGPITATK